MRAMPALGAILTITMSAGGCALLKPSQMRLTDADVGCTVTLDAGAFLDIALQGNPTTGYMWELAQADAAVIEQVGEPKFKAATKAIGSGGTVTMRFAGVGAGTTTLQLVYRRPWEKGVAPIKTFAITVVVIPRHGYRGT